MPSQSQPKDRLEKLFHRRKCWMLADLAQALSYAFITVRRLLNQIGYFRSFTANGKWYTLRTAPEFNREGLWHFKGIGFSKHGSLTATIIHLVGHSPAGLSAGELTGKLQHPCHSVLTNLHNNGVLDRVKMGGEFRYLSTDPEINRRQRQAPGMTPAPSSSAPLSTQAAVLVLVEYIKNPAQSFEQLAQGVRKQPNILVSAEDIRRFFEEHDLKKTPEPPASGP
jgi:hypothetical protein